MIAPVTIGLRNQLLVGLAANCFAASCICTAGIRSLPQTWQQAAFGARRGMRRSGSVGGVEEGEPRWLGGGSLLIPDLETTDVHLKGPPAKVQCGAHQQLVPREDRLASVARFAIAWTTPGRSDAVMWQATDMEFAPYVEAEGVIVHLWPRG